MFCVSRLTSAKTGLCPASSTACAQATHVIAGRITGEPGGRLSNVIAMYSAFDPLSTMRNGCSSRSAKRASNSRTRPPMPIQPDITLCVSDSTSS